MKKIVQFSTIGALMSGYVNGDFTLRHLISDNSLGLGCCEEINGEITVFNGKVWQATADQPLRTSQDGQVPFLQITDFTPDKTVQVKHIDDRNIKTRLQEEIALENIFLAIRMEAHFANITIRKPQHAQGRRRSITEVAQSQTEERHSAIAGNLLGFWTPELYSRISAPGFHLHFIDNTGEISGHVLSFAAEQATLSYEEKPTIEITHPDSREYKEMVINVASLDTLIHQVEK